MKHLDPKAVWLFFLNSIIGWFFLIIFSVFWLTQTFVEVEGLEVGQSSLIVLEKFISLLWFIIPGALIILWFVSKLSYHFYKYELGENGFRKECGIIWKRYVTIPYDRIQNVDIHRGILARILGLSDLHIQTAGAPQATRKGFSAEGRLPGVSVQEAEYLRDELIRRAQQRKTSGGL